MTRLRKKDVSLIGGELDAYDTDLMQKAGLTLKGIASRSAGIDEKTFSSRPAAAVPITCGRGRIGGFSEAVDAILVHLGAPVIRVSGEDVSGFVEAIGKGAEIIFAADDSRFAAIDLPRRKVVDNAGATARGYVTALESMCNGLTSRKVLVIGAAGQVGREAVHALALRGARISACDPDIERLSSLKSEVPMEIFDDLEEALKQHCVFFDASTAAGIIRTRHVNNETVIAAPGIPLGVSFGAARKAEGRLLHDPLQIGVATMLAEVLA